jgi:hypothetical protein
MLQDSRFHGNDTEKHGQPFIREMLKKEDGMTEKIL